MSNTTELFNKASENMFLANSRHIRQFDRNERLLENVASFLMANWPGGTNCSKTLVKVRLNDLFCETGVVLHPAEELKSIRNYFENVTENRKNLYDFIIRYRDDEFESDLLTFMDL